MISWTKLNGAINPIYWPFINTCPAYRSVKLFAAHVGGSLALAPELCNYNSTLLRQLSLEKIRKQMQTRDTLVCVSPGETLHSKRQRRLGQKLENAVIYFCTYAPSGCVGGQTNKRFSRISKRTIDNVMTTFSIIYKI